MNPTLPACCTPTPDASPAERAYCAYNAAGDPATAGLNYRGEPCPTWADLPENVRAKWEGAVAAALNSDAPFKPGDVVCLPSDSMTMMTVQRCVGSAPHWRVIAGRPVTFAQQRAVVGGIRRGVGHTEKAIEAAHATGVTIIVGHADIAAELRDQDTKVASLADVAARRVTGPMLFDPDAVQALFGRAIDGVAMDFGEALDAIRAGAKVRREAWNGVDDITGPDAFVTDETLDGWMGNGTPNAFGDCVGPFGSVLEAADLLARDWRVIE